MENKPNVLVTTATGRTGQSLIEALHNSKEFQCNVIASVRNSQTQQAKYIQKYCQGVREVHFPTLTLPVEQVLNVQMLIHRDMTKIGPKIFSRSCTENS